MRRGLIPASVTEEYEASSILTLLLTIEGNLVEEVQTKKARSAWQARAAAKTESKGRRTSSRLYEIVDALSGDRRIRLRDTLIEKSKGELFD
jgi:hypothetical protein